MSTGKGRGFGAAIGKEVLDAVGEDVHTDDTSRNHLQHRSTALSRLASDVVYNQSQWVDPAICIPSPVNARHYDELTYDDCADLIETIKSEGRQNMPATVRPTGNEDVPYEIVTGLRRHWSISWLRANNYPDFKYLITIQKMDDEAAFRYSDLENRARLDITDLERGQSYRQALASYYGGDYERMAERIGISSRSLRRYVQLAELDVILIEALGGLRAVRVDHAQQIKAAAKSFTHRDNMLEEGRGIAREQAIHREEGTPPIPAAEALKRLIKAAAAKRQAPETHKPVDIANGAGHTILQFVPGTSRTGATIKLLPGVKATRDEMRDAVLKLVDQFCDSRSIL